MQSIATSREVIVPRPLSWPPELSKTLFRLDILTLAVAVAIYGGYVALTWFFRDMPLWIAAPLTAVWLTWFGSLQHETIHDHPTPWRKINSALAGPPLALWIPYRIYRETHRRHHRHGGRYLTDATRDPESFFMPPGTLSKSGWLRRSLYRANCTLAGRLLLGPAISVARFWRTEGAKVLSGDRRRRIVWTRHALAVSLVLLWTAGACHIPIWLYAMLVVYPSISLSHLRSFSEHRADPDSSCRTRAVEAHPVWALIFLNNNLHIAHHAHPTLAWHRLPRAWSRMRDGARESGLVFDQGYGQVAGNHLFRPVISVEHPGFCTDRD